MPKKMSMVELQGILSAEKQDAMAAITASKLSSEREMSMDYYNGVMSDMPSIEGRSSAVSTDVADTIEGLMPSLMEIFFSGEQVVEFEPVGPEDEQGAQQETDYVNHVFLQQNEGFLIGYSFVKDSLLSKTGIVKVFWDEGETETRETYEGITDEQFAMIAADPEVEIIEHTTHEAGEEAA